MSTVQVAWLFICILITAIAFYTLGIRAGRSTAYMKGRAAGMRINAQRAADK